MNKTILFLLVASSLALQVRNVHAEEAGKTEISFGMHEKKVAKQYGEPLLMEKIKTFPVPRKKALYDLGDSDYVIIYYSFWRVQRIVFFEDTKLDEAKEKFKHG